MTEVANPSLLTLDSCPITSGPNLSDLSRPEIIEVGVNNALQNLGEFPDVFADSGHAIRDHYEANGVLEAGPEKGEMAIARHMRNLSLAVIKAIADEAVIRMVLPQMRVRKAPMPGYLPLSHGPAGCLPYVEGVGRKQQGLYSLYLNATTTLYLGATASRFGAEDEAPHPYGLLWKYASVFEQAYEASWLRYKEVVENPIFTRPNGDLRTAVVAGINDNMATNQSILLAHQRARHSQWDPGSLEAYPSYLRRTALVNAGRLLLPASVHRSTSNRMFPRPLYSGLERGVMLCRDPLMHVSHPGILVETESGDCYWRYPSLKNGSRRIEGHCVGIIDHTATASALPETNEFFSITSECAGGEPLPRKEDGKFQSATVAFAIGSLIAEHTMYRRKVPIGV